MVRPADKQNKSLTTRIGSLYINCLIYEGWMYNYLNTSQWLRDLKELESLFTKLLIWERMSTPITYHYECLYQITKWYVYKDYLCVLIHAYQFCVSKWLVHLNNTWLTTVFTFTPCPIRMNEERMNHILRGHFDYSGTPIGGTYLVGYRSSNIVLVVGYFF